MKVRVSTLSLLLLAACCLLAPAAASADFGLTKADVFFSEEDGSPALLAGTHPFAMTTTIDLNSAVEGGTEVPEGSLKDLTVELPLGLAGIPTATPRCTASEFTTLDETFLPAPISECPDDSAIGYVQIGAAFQPLPTTGNEEGAAVLWNLVPPPGTVAKFGLVYLKVPVTIELTLSETAPYRVIAKISNAPQPLLIYRSNVTVWGDPASPAHDPYRGRCFGGIEPDGTLVSQGSCPVSPGTPDTALLTLPRACQGPLLTTYLADSWEDPAGLVVAQSSTNDGAEPPVPVGFEGCADLAFSPGLGIGSSSASASSPAGFDVGVSLDSAAGVSDPSRRADSDLKTIVAKLPEGVTLNPAAAEGLTGCTTAQYEAEKLHSAPGENCPQAAKIGTVTATSPLVEEPLEGEIFAAMPDDPTTTQPHQENPFDSFLAVYLVLRNENLGVIVKQAGEVSADPVSGRLTATFDEAPQLPISTIETHFREGPRAPLSTPPRCGTYVAEALQTSWADPAEPVTTTAEFKVDSGAAAGSCPGAQAHLAPGFSAGTAANGAVTYAPLSIHLTRSPDEAELRRLSLTFPAGVLGKLAGIPYCGDAEIAAARAKSGREEAASPSCPPASQIGTVAAGVGVGSSLLYVSGKVYLAGPYGGDPLSAVIVTPGVAGPFDVGDVVLREALKPNPSTTQISVDGAVSDAIPQILKGIPLRLRDIQISIDRPGFTLNATSCDPESFTAEATGSGPLPGGDSSSVASMAARYQASGCAALPFKPKLAIRVFGKATRNSKPRLRAVLQTRSGEANIRSAQVNLPHSLFLEQNHIKTVCTRVQWAQGDGNGSACPKNSIYGHATAVSPLLEKPLEGPVYLRSSSHKLPDLVAALNGQIDVELDSRIDSGPNHGLRDTFEIVPDAPVSKFVLEMQGGGKGLLVNSENLCSKKAKRKAIVRFVGQNGKVEAFKPRVGASCKTARKSRRGS